MAHRRFLLLASTFLFAAAHAQVILPGPSRLPAHSAGGARGSTAAISIPALTNSIVNVDNRVSQIGGKLADCPFGQIRVGQVCQEVALISGGSGTSGVIPFSYSQYGNVPSGYTAAEGTASYYISNDIAMITVSGASGNAVNQSAPILMDDGGNLIGAVATNCVAGAQSCNSRYPLNPGRIPARLYVYKQ